jgi:uncharacterized protein YicC (UPF0701 family)
MSDIKKLQEEIERLHSHIDRLRYESAAAGDYVHLLTIV